MVEPPPADSPAWKLVYGFGRVHAAVFRRTRGRVGGRVGRVQMLVLHHVGRRTGKPRATPVNFEQDGPDIVVVASKGGTDRHPAWFHNIMAAGTAEVELPGGARCRVRPRVAEGAERERLWRLMTTTFPGFDAYQARTERVIPVVVLEPA